MAQNYEGLQLKELNYGSYLKVPELLSLQKTIAVPDHHDEMFFIIIHQASELWFKEILHETNILVQSFQEKNIPRSLKVLRRITAIMDVLVRQINLLSTLTPVEFAGFRDHLRPASGFQSQQFRMIEFTYGIRDQYFLQFFKKDPSTHQSLSQVMQRPSVYDEFLRLLNASGFSLPNEVLQRDYSQPYQSHASVIEVLKQLYQKTDTHYQWTLLFENMVDFDEKFVAWRHIHMIVVERTIGFKKGTGGSAGFKFLEARANNKCFPELWDVRNSIGSEY